MATVNSFRDRPSSTGNREKTGSKGFLFFGRKPSNEKSAQTQTEPKVGIFSSRTLRSEAKDPKFQVV